MYTHTLDAREFTGPMFLLNFISIYIYNNNNIKMKDEKIGATLSKFAVIINGTKLYKRRADNYLKYFILNGSNAGKIRYPPLTEIPEFSIKSVEFFLETNNSANHIYTRDKT